MQDDEDRRVEIEQEDIARRLEEMHEVEPPAGFRNHVMQQVWARASARPRTAETRRTTFAAVWAAAAVLVLGFFLVMGRPKLTDTDATMAPPAPALSVTRSGDVFTIEAVAGPSRPQTVVIGIDPATADLVGVLDEKGASFRKTQVSFTLRTASDRAGVMVRPRAGARATAVTVSAGRAEAVRRVVALE